MSEIDVVGQSLGPFGKWQLRSTLLIYLVKIPAAWFMACLIFTARTPTSEEIYCKPSYEVKNITAWIEAAHRKRFNKIENEESINFCLVKKNVTDEIDLNSENVTHTFVECAGFEHRPTFHSIIHEYGLICSREALVALSQSVHLFGVLLGGLIAFYMLKSISPRRVMVIGMIAQIFLGPLTGFAPNYELHLLFRCSAAATCSMMCIGIMIVADITSGKYRVIGVCLFEQFWSVGVILLPAVSSWWSLWSTTYIAITIPTVPLIMLWYYIPDSPRWLLKHGRVDEALQVLKNAARVNGKTDFSEDEMYKKLAELAERMRYDPPEPTLLSIWKVPAKIKLRFVVAHIGWSVYLMCYYASLLNVRAMGRRYLQVNTVLAGVSEIVGTFIALFLILKTGRKWTYMSQLNIALSLIAYSANYLPHNYPPLERTIVYMGAGNAI
ncbi:hypothetical protein HA402_005146 [Bradysia odoriphaga]|nr:hypothetical protein HA402_005146 [Bradysia odoriphaga]